MTQFIELSHVIEAGMITYIGLPGPVISDHMSREDSEYLKSSDAALVGIDSLNIDDTADGTRPAHSILLKANIPIVEHMCNLDALPEKGFKFFAVPAPVKGLGSFPARAFALID